MKRTRKEVIIIGCYQPLLRVEDRSKWTKAKDGHLYHPAKITGTKQLEWYNKELITPYTKTEIIPCGKCAGCRLDYSRDWANRAYLESLSWKHNYFVTLTYDDNALYIPDIMETSDGFTYTEIEEQEWKGILIPDDFRRFLNTFRKIMEREYKATNIRFIGCGEYGKEYRRPHYHLILFNCPLPTDTFYHPRVNYGKYEYYQNTIIERAWQKGISNICPATWNNMAYTARYIMKKQNGKESEDYYAMRGQIKEFFRSSLQPGIGRKYYEDHKEEIYRIDKIMIKNQGGTHWTQPPKYFDKLFEKENPEEFEKIKQKRKKQMIQNLKLKAQTTSLTQWEQLQIELESLENKAKQLKRPEF